MIHLSKETILKISRDMFSNKEFLAGLMLEHLTEFEGMHPEKIISECIKSEPLVNEVPISSKENGETYDIYLVAESPQLEENNKIVICVQLGISPDKTNEIIPMELSLAHQLYYEEKQKLEDDCILRCYAIWIYLDPPFNMQNKTVHMRTNVHDMNGNDMLKRDACDAVIVYLGDQPEETDMKKLN